MESTSESQALVPAESRPLKTVAGRAGMLVPRVIAEAGDQAARRFLEFFAATIRNKNTRMAYYHAVARFFAWVDRHKIGEIADIEPLHVAAYIEILGKDFEAYLARRRCATVRRLAADDPAHRRIMAQAFSVVHVLVSGEAAKKRVACKDRDSQDHGLRREPYAGQCTYSG